MLEGYVATVRKILNGFILETEEGEFFTENFTPLAARALVTSDQQHERNLRSMVLAFPDHHKIPAIKAVREYSNNNKLSYSGLKDAKDFVERVRPEWHWPDPYSAPVELTGRIPEDDVPF